MNGHYPFVNPPLPYAYDALEPYIDSKTLQLHRERHLQTYIDNLNAILKDYPEYQELSLEQLLLYPDLLPASIRAAIKNNAGGVYNHIFYFSTLKKPSPLPDNNALLTHITAQFGSIENFLDTFLKAGLSVFGSGYAWLVQDAHRFLKIVTTSNQDTPLTANLSPILPLDVWEHAYYLKHYNKRADYIRDWMHIINWDEANKKFSSLV